MIVVQLATGDVLLLILQRYYFESESQLIPGLSFASWAVAYPTKILFWKRITAPDQQEYSNVSLLLILQRYYFESESQRPSSSAGDRQCCCLSYKDTILKANHSLRSNGFLSLKLLLILQRYYFESESQLSSSSCMVIIAVAYPTKILFWKRITAYAPMKHD